LAGYVLVEAGVYEVSHFSNNTSHFLILLVNIMVGKSVFSTEG